MTTFARLINGQAIDCQVCTASTELSARYHPAWLAVNTFDVVPDGTVHGRPYTLVATGIAWGSNPPPPQPVVADATLPRGKARDHVVQALGGNGIGSAKLQGYVDIAAANTATSVAAQNMRFALQAFRTDDAFTKDEAASIMTAMQFASGDRALVLNSWPVVQVS